MAKEIARILGPGITKKDINPILYRNNIFLEKDFHWFLSDADHMILELDKHTWVDLDSFESSLAKTGCMLTSDAKYFLIKFPEKCQPLLESTTRILAIANQLILLGKKVTIDLRDCNSTKTYLNRLGFFDLLNKKVHVAPNRPEHSTAQIYTGNSNALVELGEIDPANPNIHIPMLLKNTFVARAGEKYSDAAFTFFSELFGNVCEHSQTPIPGFAALQIYNGKRPHIQTVVSDSGMGIAESLKPILKLHYPDLHKRFDFNDPNSNALLIKEVLEKGRISNKGPSTEEGRGLGLRRSHQYAEKYNANISIRQDTFELRFIYQSGQLSGCVHYVNRPKILGTHICFDFFLD